MTHPQRHDVVILGSGIGGSLLAAILARHGVDTLVLERGSHPRFAIGESTIPETTALLGILGERYDVPEISQLSNFQSVRRGVSSACGIKRNFSFVHHREGQEQVPQHSTQFPTWAPPFGPDIHLFRQDVDSYALATAVRYGAQVQQQTGVKSVELKPSGVTLETERGEVVEAKFLVDGTGFRSLLAHQLGLRETPTSLCTRSRSLFTHMVDVVPYDAVGPSRREHGLPSPFHQGTLHHIFEGGWLWVIPFYNHPSSTNPLCSVGFCLDIDRFPPRPELTPEQEFRELVGRFPSVARQFEKARSVREWVSTPRVQYSSTQTVGDRFALLPHSAGFVDALFSSGLSLTMATLNVLAHRLITAVELDDFRRERFEHVETWLLKNLRYYDRLVACSFTAFRDFDLWNAWHRVWLLGSLYGVSGQHEAFSRLQARGSAREGTLFEEAPYRGNQAIDLPEYAALFDQAAIVVEGVREGDLEAAEAVERLYELLAGCELCPAPWKMTDRRQRCPGTFTFLPMVRLVAWGRYRGPEVVRRHYFQGGRGKGLVGGIWSGETSELRQSVRLGLGLLRDSLFSWNDDWKSSRKEAHPWRS